jgi:dihydroorotase
MEFVFDSPLDMHLHLREGAMMERVTPLSAEHFSGAIIMPNLVPPVDNLERLQVYRDQINVAKGDAVFDPLMMLFFRKYSEVELAAAREHIFGIKLYPAGATTNSEAGPRQL